MANNLQQVKEFRGGLEKMRPELEKALPAHVSVDKFERVTQTAVQRQPDLLDVDRRSLFGAVVQCASDGLVPDGREAALVKFKGAASYMPMVAGLLKLARQSGEIASLSAQVVYTGDTFDFWLDENGEHLSHRPELVGERGEPIGVYALARTKDGESVIEWMRVSDVEKVRKASRAANGGPWKDWWEEMAKKTAIRRLFKRLPKSTDRLDQAIERDNQFYSFDRPAGAEPATESAPSAEESVGAIFEHGAEDPIAGKEFAGQNGVDVIDEGGDNSQ